MEKEDILNWNKKYDSEYPWWIQKEEEMRNRLRNTRKLTRQDLIEIVEWKFKELPGRKKRILGLIAKNDDVRIKQVSIQFFNTTSEDDSIKVDTLCLLHGVGPALASTILTFLNPKDYGVFDIHVWRELFGKEAKNEYLWTTENYLKVLVELRKIARTYSLDARTVEKALFKKNLDETKNIESISGNYPKPFAG